MSKNLFDVIWARAFVPWLCMSKTLTLINGTARFKKCKQLFEYQHLLLLRDI